MPSISASEIDQRGWDRVVEALHEEGLVSVTHDGKLQAIVLTPEKFAELAEAVRESEGLAKVRAQFVRKLACLNEPGTRDRLVEAFSAPVDLRGEVKAGDTY